MYGRSFTKREDDFLRANYLTIPAKRMSMMLGRREGTARQRMKLLGIVVPAEILDRFKQLGRLQKGNVPFNKGRKWKDYMSKGSIKNCRKTTFKKGTVPPNHKPVGSERVEKDGYVYIKVREGIGGFTLKHRHIYEQHYGPIPKGYNVEFKDRDRANFSLENLVLRTRSENMKLNTYHNYPKEIANAIQLMGALQRQINKRKKVLNEK
jgi:hypothetical protein